jgi:hypothetical protein
VSNAPRTIWASGVTGICCLLGLAVGPSWLGFQSMTVRVCRDLRRVRRHHLHGGHAVTAELEAAVTPILYPFIVFALLAALGVIR